MKRLLYILISVMLLLSVVACGKVSSTEEAKPASQEVQTEAESEGEAETQEEPEAEEPKETEESSEEPQLDLSEFNLQYGQQEEFKKLYEQIHPVEQAEAFEGTWYRTDVVTGLSAEVTITEQTEEGFSFVGDFYYFSHSGWMEGSADFVAPNVAVFQYINEWSGEGTTQEYLVFEKAQDGMQVYASAASADLGFGMNVFADGRYVQGEPEYTNATVFEDNFTVEVQEAMQGLLGDAYEDYFKTVVEIGVLTSTPATLEDGGSATYYEAYIPTMGGYAFELLVCESGELYFYSEAEEVGWKTDVEGAIDYPVYETEEN